jgi:Peptidase family M1 domain
LGLHGISSHLALLHGYRRWRVCANSITDERTPAARYLRTADGQRRGSSRLQCGASCASVFQRKGRTLSLREAGVDCRRDALWRDGEFKRDFSSTTFNLPLDSPPLSRHFNVRRGLVEVTAHEVAHQWFGDSVSIKTWSDLWLSEGFATYFTALFTERFDGQEAFREFMRRAAKTYFAYEQGRRAPIHDTETEDLMKLLNANNYQKGAWVLHMLRGMMGDEAFFKGIRIFYNKHEDKSASTEDLRAALEKASGRNLKEFFARWVYGSGHPRYEASWSWREGKGERGTLKIHLRQTQEDAPFLTPLPVEIVMANKIQQVTLTPGDRATSMIIPLSSRPVDVRIDPNETILKELVVRQEPLIKARSVGDIRASSRSR